MGFISWIIIGGLAGYIASIFMKTEEKKVAFTMNCAWNADDIDSILKTLDDNNVKITFFMVGDWVDKYPKKVEEIAKRGHEIRKP